MSLSESLAFRVKNLENYKTVEMNQEDESQSTRTIKVHFNGYYNFIFQSTSRWQMDKSSLCRMTLWLLFSSQLSLVLAKWSMTPFSSIGSKCTVFMHFECDPKNAITPSLALNLQTASTGGRRCGEYDAK